MPATNDVMAASGDTDTKQAHAEFIKILPQVQSGAAAPEVLINLIGRVPGEDVGLAVQAFEPYLTHAEDSYREQASTGLIIAAVHCHDYAPIILEKLQPLRDDPSHLVRANLINTLGYLGATTTEYFPQMLKFLKPMTRDSDEQVSLLAASAVLILRTLPDERKQEIMAAKAALPAKRCPAL